MENDYIVRKTKEENNTIKITTEFDEKIEDFELKYYCKFELNNDTSQLFTTKEIYVFKNNVCIYYEQINDNINAVIAKRIVEKIANKLNTYTTKEKKQLLKTMLNIKMQRKLIETDKSFRREISRIINQKIINQKN